jgi:hypothetical protein
MLAIRKSSILLMGDCISSDDSSVETFKYPLESGSYLSNPGERRKTFEINLHSYHLKNQRIEFKDS